MLLFATWSIKKSSDRAWSREAALRVIDCVLSLNRNYDRFVVPRLDRFEQEYPNVRSVSELHDLIASFPSPHQFALSVLHYNHEERASTLRAVADWLVTISGQDSYAEQLSRLERWAYNARPEDHRVLRIPGFGLAGLQYLRMLFGANTTKPDIHIRRFVASELGHDVSDVQALQLLEYAAQKADISLRDLDTTLWERSARTQASP